MRLSYSTVQECFELACAELRDVLSCDEAELRDVLSCDESAFIDNNVTFFVEGGCLYVILKLDSVMIRMAWEGAWILEWIC